MALAVLGASLPARAGSAVKNLSSHLLRPQRMPLEEWNGLRSLSTLGAKDIERVMAANVAEIFHGYKLPEMPVVASNPYLDQAIFLVLEGTTLENAKAQSAAELRTAKKNFARSFLEPTLLEDFPKNITLFRKLIPYLSGQEDTGEDSSAISDMIQKELSRLQLRQNRFDPRPQTAATPEQRQLWVLLLTYGFYYVDRTTLLDIHYDIGRDYFPQEGAEGLSDMLSAVTDAYFQFPEQDTELEDKSEAVGMKLIALLSMNQNTKNLQTLGSILGRSKIQAVRLAARDAVSDYLPIATYTAQATAILTLNNGWATFWSICSALLQGLGSSSGQSEQGERPTQK